MLQTDHKEVILPSNHTTDEVPKGNVGHDIIVYGGEEIDITVDNISEEESVEECNEQDDEF